MTIHFYRTASDGTNRQVNRTKTTSYLVLPFVVVPAEQPPVFVEAGVCEAGVTLGAEEALLVPGRAADLHHEPAEDQLAAALAD